jgi:hypothetical protein
MPVLGVLDVGLFVVGAIAVGVLAVDVDCGTAQDKEPLLQLPLVVLYAPPLLHEAHGLPLVPWIRSNVLPEAHTLHMAVPELNEPGEHCGVQLFVLAM